MNLPVVAIVGRPNVGKSSLFNRMIGRRLAVVEDTPGVTRDRLYAEASWGGRTFSVVDTGGLDLLPDDPVIDRVKTQVEVAIREASVILFVVDVIAGITGDDILVAESLRTTSKPVLVVAHKADHPGLDANAAEAYELGFADVFPVSSIHRHGISDLMDATVSLLPEAGEPLTDADERRPIRIAIVGKPNAGKSSIINALIGEERVIVDDRPGTTRDAINVRFEWQSNEFELVDTAGMRRRTRIEARSVEQHAVLRATTSIERCDVAWLVLDVTQEISHQDKAIADLVDRHGKLCILVANKWDLVEKDHTTFNEFTEWVRDSFRAFDYLPIVFTSAVTRQRLDNLLELSLRLYTAGATRVPTAELNDFLRQTVVQQAPALVRGRRPSLKYITQVDVLPPTFAVFTNLPESVPDSYTRFLASRIRDQFGYEGVPLRILYRQSGNRTR